MIIIGLTGSIAMGKSETARMFAAAGIPVFDADATVHGLYADGGAAAAPIAALVPAAATGDGVDRAALALHLQAHPGDFARVEAIVHPMVRRKQAEFLARHRAAGTAMVLLDSPLLFETGRQAEVDVIVVVSAPPEVQRARALARPGMTEARLAAILARQMPDHKKRERAHYTVGTAISLADAARQVQDIVGKIRAG